MAHSLPKRQFDRIEWHIMAQNVSLAISCKQITFVVVGSFVDDDSEICHSDWEHIRLIYSISFVHGCIHTYAYFGILSSRELRFFYYDYYYFRLIHLIVFFSVEFFRFDFPVIPISCACACVYMCKRLFQNVKAKHKNGKCRSQLTALSMNMSQQQPLHIKVAMTKVSHHLWILHLCEECKLNIQINFLDLLSINWCPNFIPTTYVFTFNKSATRI